MDVDDDAIVDQRDIDKKNHIVHIWPREFFLLESVCVSSIRTGDRSR